MAKVAIVGRGWGVRSQEPNFGAAGLDVIAVTGRDDWRSVLQTDADLISIAMPPALHVEMALAALEAGKHVLSEKPTALNVQEAETLAAAAAAHPDLIAIIDHELRFVPAFRAARERLTEIGGLRYVEARYCSGSWSGDKPASWWNDAAQGGGVWNAVGSHFVDVLHSLEFSIEAVQAVLKTVVPERSGKPSTSDELASVQLRLNGGVMATMHFTAVAATADEPSTMTLHGETGAFRLTGEELLFADRKQPFRRVAGDDLAKRPGNSTGGAFGTGTYLLGLALKRAIDEGDRGALAAAATFADGLRVQTILDAARRSNSNGGRWEEL